MKTLARRIYKTYKDMDKSLLFVTIALFIFGLFNIVTASSSEAVSRYDVSIYHYFIKHLEMLTIGFICFLVVISISSKKYKTFAILGFILIMTALLYLLIYGNFHKGAKNWLSVMGFTFQPSEFIKPIVIVCLSLFFEKNYKRLRDKKKKHNDLLGMVLFIGLFPAIIIFLQMDLGTMFILTCIFGVLFLASPILRIDKLRTIILLLVLMVFAMLILQLKKGYILSPAQMARFNFYKPCSNYETGGYQVCNAFIALNDGGMFGVGISKSKQKYSYIPEPHTDMVFAIIGEELGFLKCSLIFIAYGFILYKILDLSSKATSIRGRYICLGVATFIFMHIIVNLGGLFGVMPLTGVPLPFLSYGGSFTVSLIISLGLVQRIHIETKRKAYK